LRRVQLVVSDTGPINYLLLIGHIDILPLLFERVFMPVAVRDELTDSDAPAAVRDWMATPPQLVEARASEMVIDNGSLNSFDDGEREAIMLASSLLGKRCCSWTTGGVHVARQKGLAVTGTIGVLDLAAQRGLFELGMAPLRKFRMRSAAACASPIFSSAVVSGRDCLKGGKARSSSSSRE